MLFLAWITGAAEWAWRPMAIGSISHNAGALRQKKSSTAFMRKAILHFLKGILCAYMFKLHYAALTKSSYGNILHWAHEMFWYQLHTACVPVRKFNFTK